VVLALCYKPEVTFSQQANYTNWARASGQRILVPTFADRGVSRGQLGGKPNTVNLSFLDRSRYFTFQVAPHLSSGRWVDPVPDPLLLRKSGSARNRIRDLCDCSQKPWPLEQWGGQQVQGSINNWILSIYLILQFALGPGMYSHSNRNEYQKQTICFCPVSAADACGWRHCHL
jgi:hypothetical protein